MHTERQQLVNNLSYLFKNEDVYPGPFATEIIAEYASLIDTKRLDDLLEFTNNEVESDLGRG
jgi:hypothetical protein